MANSVRGFVIESLKGFYDRLPFKNGLTEITYGDLKILRDSSSLIPGMQYRITDYHCSTTQQYTSTADNQFDIIVTADSSTVLNENARAVKHTDSSTDYFAKCNLEAWKLKYCIDNDKERFTWAKELKSPTSHQDIIGILNNNTNYEDIYLRYPLLDSSIGYAWVLAQTMASLSILEWIYEIENFGEGNEGLLTDYTIYTDTLYPSIGDILTNGPVVETSWGQGIVYYMKDEWNNECPYDFKNIKFQRWAVTACPDCSCLVVDDLNNPYGYYYGAKWLNGNNVLNNATYGEDNDYFYTFALKDLESGEWFDYTVVAHLGLKGMDGIEVGCNDNYLAEVINGYSFENGKMVKILNNIVFFNCYTNLSDTSFAMEFSLCNRNHLLGGCQLNTFGNDCYCNLFGNFFSRNIFGAGCRNNSFRNECYDNIFGNGCRNNSFGNECYNNLFGNGCCYNSFDNNCYYNSFGTNCNSNSFGNNCNSNLFNDGCCYNSFGNNCCNNSFSNGCEDNSFGNGCCYNSFDNNCYYNSFGNNSNRNLFGAYCQSITVFDNVIYCYITGGTNSAPVKNAQILNDTKGVGSSNRLTITFTANQSYTQIAGLNSSGVLKIWTPADLID